VLLETRRFEAPELGASYRSIDLRAPSLRAGVHRSRNVANDYGLVARASPFLERLARSGLTVVLEGHARFDEGGEHGWLEAGELVLDDQSRHGTEAHGGASSRVVVLEWSPAFAGAPKSGRFEIHRLGARDRARWIAAADAFEADPSVHGVAKLLDAARASGLPFERLSAGDLASDAPPLGDQRLAHAMGDALTRLDAHPAIEEVGDALGWNVRTVHRRIAAIAERYVLPWAHWRSALHHTRVVHAIRLLAAPGATTEGVARATGFRSPTALCHAFANAGLPSPGVLSRAAKGDVLARWSELMPKTRRARSDWPVAV
jgi:AraC-like DNA-binding protein